MSGKGQIIDFRDFFILSLYTRSKSYHSSRCKPVFSTSLSQLENVERENLLITGLHKWSENSVTAEINTLSEQTAGSVTIRGIIFTSS